MIDDIKQHVAALTVSIHIPAAQSLKEKRMVLRRIKDKIRARYNVSVAEIAGQTKWQTATLCFAMTGADHAIIRETLDKISATLKGMGDFFVCEEQEEFFH